MKSIYNLYGVAFLALATLTACGGGSSNSDDSRSVNSDDREPTPLASPNPTFCGDRGATRPSAALDPLEKYQWYLDRVSVKEVWGAELDGAGIQIGILDEELEIGHEDLKANIAVNKSLNVGFDGARHDPLDHFNPTDCSSEGHGTAVAGIIAAAGGNGLGIKGIAHQARIFGVNLVAFFTTQGLRDGLSRNWTETAVSSNSWGFSHPSRLRGKLDSLTKTVLEMGLTEGFNGKGISYVFAAGNDRNTSEGKQDLATYEELHNYPGIIVVCAVGSDNRSASFSNPGANLWVCGPSDTGNRVSDLTNVGLPTVDLSGDLAGYNARLSDAERVMCGPTAAPLYPSHCFDFGRPYDYARVGGNANYHRFFTGTSAATPVVSGVIALLRQANSNLTWRDIKLILAQSAEQVDSDSTSDWIGLGWQTTGRHHNGSARYRYHHDYGFGLINASAALALVRNWNLLPDAEEEIGPIAGTRVSRTDGRQTYDFTVAADINFIEYAQVAIQSAYPNFGNLSITLISPQGSRSRLTHQHQCYIKDSGMAVTTNDCADLENGFLFGTTVHLGEDPSGVWQLQIVGPNQEGTDYTVSMTLHGHRRQ